MAKTVRIYGPVKTPKEKLTKAEFDKIKKSGATKTTKTTKRGK